MARKKGEAKAAKAPYGAKSRFIRTRPIDEPAADLIEHARHAGIQLTKDHIYTVRVDMRKQAAATASPKSSKPSRSTTDSDGGAKEASAPCNEDASAPAACARATIAPTRSALRRAAQIPVILDELDRLRARAGEDVKTTYYFLGPTGTECEERLTKLSFFGKDDENPRMCGYYAVIATSANGETLQPSPWYAIFRDYSSDVRSTYARGSDGDAPHAKAAPTDQAEQILLSAAKIVGTRSAIRILVDEEARAMKELAACASASSTEDAGE